MKRKCCLLALIVLLFIPAFIYSGQRDEKPANDGISKEIRVDEDLYIKEDIEKFRDKEKKVINRISFSGGNIIITPSPKKGYFYGGTFWYETVFHSPLFEIADKRDAYVVNLRQRKSKVYIFPSNQRRPIWKYSFPCDISAELDISLSGSNTMIELGGSLVENINISARGQETALMFSEPVKGMIHEAVISVDVGKLSVLDILNSNTAYMKMNLSSGSYFMDFSGKADKLKERTVDITLNFSKLDISLSDDVGYEIYTSTLVHISAPDLVKNEDYHRTPGFEKAERRIYINIRGVGGKVNIIY